MEIFFESPSFGLDGKCRMKHESAQCMTMPEFGAACPECLEALYVNVRSPALYGTAVRKLFSGIEDQLRSRTPRRGAFLRLLKDIAEFCLAKRQGDAGPI